MTCAVQRPLIRFIVSEDANPVTLTVVDMSWLRFSVINAPLPGRAINVSPASRNYAPGVARISIAARTAGFTPRPHPTSVISRTRNILPTARDSISARSLSFAKGCRSRTPIQKNSNRRGMRLTTCLGMMTRSPGHSTICLRSRIGRMGRTCRTDYRQVMSYSSYKSYLSYLPEVYHLNIRGTPRSFFTSRKLMGMVRCASMSVI